MCYGKEIAMRIQYATEWGQRPPRHGRGNSLEACLAGDDEDYYHRPLSSPKGKIGIEIDLDPSVYMNFV
jgi:hypothetical protein